MTDTSGNKERFNGALTSAANQIKVVYNPAYNALKADLQQQQQQQQQ